jgi:hypothetical protein
MCEALRPDTYIVVPGTARIMLEISLIEILPTGGSFELQFYAQCSISRCSLKPHVIA